MSDEIETPEEGAGGAPDVQNLKAEFSRKMEKTSADVAALKQSNEQVIAALEAFAAKSSPPAPAADDSDDEDLLYSDPSKYKAKLKAEVLQEVNQVQQSREASQQVFQQTVAELVSDFPELNRTDTEMYKKTMEVLQQYPQDQRNSPAVMRAASYQAAVDIGLPPSSKRAAQDDDSFSLSAVGGNPRSGKKSSEVDEKTKTIAGLFGMNTEDKETIENLKNRQKRDSWTNWR